MKILPMKLTSRFIAGLLLAFLGMILLWTLTPKLTEGGAKFDDLPYPVYFFWGKLLAFTSGLIAGGRHWVCPVLVALAALAGQSFCMIISNSGDPWLFTALFMQVFRIGIFLLPAALGTVVALGITLLIQRLRPAV